MHRIESDQALRVLNRDLGALLSLPDVEFWKVVKMQPSLNGSIDSYLRFRRRIFDADDADATRSETHHSLSRRVFFLLMRLCDMSLCSKLKV